MDHRDLTHDIKEGLARGHEMRAAAFASAGRATGRNMRVLGTALFHLLRRQGR